MGHAPRITQVVLNSQLQGGASVDPTCSGTSHLDQIGVLESLEVRSMPCALHRDTSEQSQQCGTVEAAVAGECAWSSTAFRWVAHVKVALT